MGEYRIEIFVFDSRNPASSPKVGRNTISKLCIGMGRAGVARWLLVDVGGIECGRRMTGAPSRRAIRK
jgi:hypothetical protein